MRTQDQNPAYRRYAHLLPENGRYPVAHVQIFWNETANHKIRDVEVAFMPRGLPEMPDPADDPQFWESYASYNKRWLLDLGNSGDDWLTPVGRTAESVFARLLRAGFADENELKRAIEEFAHIEECAWARAMLDEFSEAT